MASKVRNVLSLIGRRIPDAGGAIYHAADGVSGGGAFNKDQRHAMRKKLRNMRLRATGMSDDLLGSKEVSGALSNKHEQEP